MTDPDTRDERSHPRGGYAEPGLTETESARLLANEHRDQLRELGLDDEQIRRLADDYIAETDGEPSAFLAWAKDRVARRDVP